MHILNVYNRKPAGSAKVLIRPLSLQDKFISILDGSLLPGKQGYVSVKPYYERKRTNNKEPPRKVPHTTWQPQEKEPCVVFVGPVLPHFINKSDIQAHFREHKDAIANIEFKGDQRRRGCYVLLTFKSASSAMRAIDRYNRTFVLGKHKIKVELYKPYRAMSSTASCPTMQGSTASSMHMLTRKTKSKQASSTETASTLKDEAPSSDKVGTLDNTAFEAKQHSAGPHFIEPLSSCEPLESCAGKNSTIGPVSKEFIPPYSDDEEDQLQNTVTTVIVENLDPNITQKELESLTGVNIICYTPSHLTPEKTAAWIEVANSKYACTFADKLDGKMICGKKVYCSLTDSCMLQEQSYAFPSLKDPPKEELPLSQPILPSHDAQQEYLSLFFLGDKHPLQESHTSFSQDPTITVPFIFPSDSPLPVQEPKPPIPVAPL